MAKYMSCHRQVSLEESIRMPYRQVSKKPSNFEIRDSIAERFSKFHPEVDSPFYITLLRLSIQRVARPNIPKAS